MASRCVASVVASCERRWRGDVACIVVVRSASLALVAWLVASRRRGVVALRRRVASSSHRRVASSSHRAWRGVALRRVGRVGRGVVRRRVGVVAWLVAWRRRWWRRGVAWRGGVGRRAGRVVAWRQRGVGRVVVAWRWWRGVACRRVRRGVVASS
ncbi:hypothetical protein ACXZ9C_11590 [Streptococcus agalactiae]